MAELQQTQQLTNPILEASLSGFLEKLNPLGGQAINTAGYAPQVAARNALQTAPETAAAGLGSLVGTGAGGANVQGSIASYMSPYQQQVMDASLSEFDRNAAMQQAGARDDSIRSGAYGGARQGVMQAEALRGSNMDRAQLQSGLLQQGFENAQAARAGDLTAQQGLGTYQQGLGTGQQGYQQALLDATQVANREEQYSPFTQIGLIGQQLSQMTPGTYPTTMTTTTPSSVAPTSPLQSYLGAAGTAGGILGKLLG